MRPTRRLPPALALVAALAVLAPGALQAEEPTGLSAVFAALEAARPTLVTPVWDDVKVELERSGGQLRATISGSIALGRAGVVDVVLLAAAGVQEVRFAGSAAAARVQGGVVVLRLDASADRAGEVQVTLALPFDSEAGHAVAVPLPACRSANLQETPSGLEVLGARSDGVIDGSQRALLVRGDASDAPRVRAARYALLLRPGAAEVALQVEVIGRGGRGTVALAPAAIALRDVQIDGKPVATEDDDDEHHSVAVDGRGPRLISARFVVPTEGDADDLRVTLGRVAAAITEVEVRVAGKRAIRFEPEVPLQSSLVAGQTVVRGFLPPGETLEIGFSADGDAVERTVRFSAESYHVLTMDEGVLRARASIELQIVQGKATALQIALPDEAVVSAVEGEAVTTWDVLAPAGELPRRLRVALGEGEGQTRTLTVIYERPVAATAGTAFELPLVRPLGAFRESGAVVLIDGEKVGFKAIEGAPGWLRAGLEALPAPVRQTLDGRGDQVFRHLGAPAKLPGEVAAARVREVRLEARGTTLVRIDERALRASHVVVVEVKAGRADKLYLDLPEAVGEPRVVAPNLSKVAAAEGAAIAGTLAPTKGRRLWELRFTTALEGAIQLQIDLEQLIAADAKELALPAVRIRGAEVETGVLALAAEPGLELTPKAEGETRPVPPPELPEALAKQAGRDLVAGFRSPRGAVRVVVGLQRRATVATLDAYAQRVFVDSHVLSDGRIATRAVVQVQSTGRPVLRVGLPEGAQVLAIAVDGADVKAVRDDKGGLAVPLGGAGAVTVELRYEQRIDALGVFASVALAAPRLDVRQGPLQWRVLLPGDREVLRVDSDLRVADGAAWAETPAPGRELVPLPQPFEPRELRYGAEVRDADAEAAIAVTFAPVSVDGLLWLLVLAGGGWLIWRWRRRRAARTESAFAAARQANDEAGL